MNSIGSRQQLGPSQQGLANGNVFIKLMIDMNAVESVCVDIDRGIHSHTFGLLNYSCISLGARSNKSISDTILAVRKSIRVTLHSCRRAERMIIAEKLMSNVESLSILNLTII